MQQTASFQEKRRFGRRVSDIRGAAIVAGQMPKPFTMRDLSDGGALLCFDEPYTPEKSFRILVDGTTFVLLCEVRHIGRAGVGVHFMRPSEGMALNRYFLLKPIEGVQQHATQLQPRVPPALQPTRGRDLRETLDIVTPAEVLRPAPEPHPEPPPPRIRRPLQTLAIRLCALIALYARSAELLADAAVERRAAQHERVNVERT